MNADPLNLAFRKLEYVDTQQLLRRLDKAWVAFKDSYAGLSESDVLEPGVTKAWSVRDIIAHVTTWDEEELKHLPAILKGRRPPLYSVTYGGIDAFNALMTTKKAGLLRDHVCRDPRVPREIAAVFQTADSGSRQAGALANLGES
jgi:hypothetical protein